MLATILIRWQPVYAGAIAADLRRPGGARGDGIGVKDDCRIGPTWPPQVGCNSTGVNTLPLSSLSLSLSLFAHSRAPCTGPGGARGGLEHHAMGRPKVPLV
jgi:hypothetical protein